jgi:hypothetical protein
LGGYLPDDFTAGPRLVFRLWIFAVGTGFHSSWCVITSGKTSGLRCWMNAVPAMLRAFLSVPDIPNRTIPRGISDASLLWLPLPWFLLVLPCSCGYLPFVVPYLSATSRLHSTANRGYGLRPMKWFMVSLSLTLHWWCLLDVRCWSSGTLMIGRSSSLGAP